MFAFIRAWSSDPTTFFSAAQSGTLTGTAPFTFGSLFSIQSVQDASGGISANPQTIFGNAVFGTSGFGHRQTAPGATGGKIVAAQGTNQQIFGTAEAAADATYGLDPEGDLINLWRANARGELIAGGAATAEFPTVKPNQMIFLITVIDGTNQLTYVNGQLAASVARNTTANANDIAIGASPVGGGENPATDIDISGCFYHSAAMDELAVKAMVQSAMMAEDVVNPRSLEDGVLPDYIWSVKRGNPNGAASWTSSGGQTPITMTLQGSSALLSRNVYGANRAWYSAGA